MCVCVCAHVETENSQMASIGVMHVHFYTGVAGCSSESDSAYGITQPSTGVNMNATTDCPDSTGIL